jgi:hypothetical protein
MIEIYGTDQSTGEIRTHFVDFSNDLPAGVTVSSGTAALISYPSGGTATLSTGVIASNVVPVTVTSPTTAGQYIIDVTATLSDAEKSVVRLIVQVYWTAARGTMAGIIAQLRSLTDAGANDYTIAGARHWTDIQMQDVLDTHRTDIDCYQLLQNPRYESGTLVYKEFRSSFNWLEGGTALYVQDGTHTNVSSASYTADALRGVVTFTTDTKGSTYYLYGVTYDIYGAAADVWRRKASHVAEKFDFSTDNHSVSRSQMVNNCLKMAGFYAQRAGGMGASLMYERGDTSGRGANYDRD